jgi:hypothetical protein
MTSLPEGMKNDDDCDTNSIGSVSQNKNPLKTHAASFNSFGEQNEVIVSDIGRNHPYRKPYLYGLAWQRKNFASIVLPRAHSIERSKNVFFDEVDRGVRIEDKLPQEIVAFPKVERFLTGAEKRILRQQRIAARRTRRNEAAVTIQVLFRGAKARHLLKQHLSAVIIQRQCRAFLARRKVLLLREKMRRRQNAAVVIQTRVRSNLAKKKYMIMKRDLRIARETEAAIRIQRVQRGTQARSVIVRILLEPGHANAVLLRRRYATEIKKEQERRLLSKLTAEAHRLHSYHKLPMFKRLRLDIIDFLGCVGNQLYEQESESNTRSTNVLCWGHVVTKLKCSFLETDMRPETPAGSDNETADIGSNGGDDGEDTDDEGPTTSVGAPELLKILKFLTSRYGDAVVPDSLIALDMGVRTNCLRAFSGTLERTFSANSFNSDNNNNNNTYSSLQSPVLKTSADLQPARLEDRPVEFSRLADALLVELILMDVFYHCAEVVGHAALFMAPLGKLVKTLQLWRLEDETLAEMAPTFNTFLKYTPRSEKWFDDARSKTKLFTCEMWCQTVNFDPEIQGYAKFKASVNQILTMPLRKYDILFPSSHQEERTSTRRHGSPRRFSTDDHTHLCANQRIDKELTYLEAQCRLQDLAPMLCWQFPTFTSTVEMVGKKNIVAMLKDTFDDVFFRSHDTFNKGRLSVNVISKAILDEFKLRRIFELAARSRSIIQSNMQNAMAQGSDLLEMLTTRASLCMRVQANVIFDLSLHFGFDGKGHMQLFSDLQFRQFCNRPMLKSISFLQKVEHAFVSSANELQLEANPFAKVSAVLCKTEGAAATKMWFGVQHETNIEELIQRATSYVKYLHESGEVEMHENSVKNQMEDVLYLLWRMLQLRHLHGQLDWNGAGKVHFAEWYIALQNHRCLRKHFARKFDRKATQTLKDGPPRSVIEMCDVMFLPNHQSDTGPMSARNVRARPNVTWREAANDLILSPWRHAFDTHQSPLVDVWPKYKPAMRKSLTVKPSALKHWMPIHNVTHDESYTIPDKSINDAFPNEYVWWSGTHSLWNGKVQLTELLDKAGHHDGVRIIGQPCCPRDDQDEIVSTSGSCDSANKSKKKKKDTQVMTTRLLTILFYCLRQIYMKS